MTTIRTLPDAMATAVEAFASVNTMMPGTKILSVTLHGPIVRVTIEIPEKGRFVDTYEVRDGMKRVATTVHWISLEPVAKLASLGRTGGDHE